MAKRTQQARLIAALRARGETIVPSRSSKFITLTRKPVDAADAVRMGLISNGKPWFWFVGKRGALRSGTTSSNSTPRDNIRGRLLAEVPE